MLTAIYSHKTGLPLELSLTGFKFSMAGWKTAPAFSSLKTRAELRRMLLNIVQEPKMEVGGGKGE